MEIKINKIGRDDFFFFHQKYSNTHCNTFKYTTYCNTKLLVNTVLFNTLLSIQIFILDNILHYTLS